MLSVHDLKVTYQGKHIVLSGLDLQADRGAFIAILGRSGAGKTTLLRCLNGLQRPTSGSIRLGGNAISELRERQLASVRRRIGFIWQEHNLVDRLSVLTNVLTGRLGYRNGPLSLVRYFSQSDRQRALAALERVNLAHLAAQRADRISGGEKQRVAIARALTQSPELILADEPVASLDPELAWQVLQDLTRITREDHLLTIVNLHQVELAKAFADRIIGIAGGRVAFDGPPGELDKAAHAAIYRSDAATTSAPSVGSIASVAFTKIQSEPTPDVSR